MYQNIQNKNSEYWGTQVSSDIYCDRKMLCNWDWWSTHFGMNNEGKDAQWEIDGGRLHIFHSLSKVWRITRKNASHIQRFFFIPNCTTSKTSVKIIFCLSSFAQFCEDLKRNDDLWREASGTVSSVKIFSDASSPLYKRSWYVGPFVGFWLIDVFAQWCNNTLLHRVNERYTKLQYLETNYSSGSLIHTLAYAYITWVINKYQFW